jgi:hypothetical protein
MVMYDLYTAKIILTVAETFGKYSPEEMTDIWFLVHLTTHSQLRRSDVF